MLDLFLPQKEPQQAVDIRSDRFSHLQTIFAAVLLCVIGFLCYGNALHANFNCDDYSRIHYAHRIFNGHPELLLREFTSAWPDGSFQLQYRPIFEFSFVIDYLFWKANAFGYHLSNIFLHCLTSFLFFLTSRQIFSSVQTKNSFLLALFSAALYACYPLSCEVVSWVGCRVDSICAAFYFAAFWLFFKSAKSASKGLSAFSLGTFFLSLLSKEMGASLPLVLFAWVYLSPAANLRSTASKLKAAFHATFSYWVVLLLYIAGRAIILGNLVGGYVGSTGESIAESTLNRWLNSGCLYYVAYPLNAAFYSSHCPMAEAFHAGFLIAGLLVIWRTFRIGWSEIEKRIIAFSVIWLIFALLPIFSVFYISPFLQGGRYFYIPAAALCLLLPFALLSVQEQVRKRQSRIFQLAALSLLVCLLTCFTSACRTNGKCWTESAKQTIALKSALVRTIAQMPPDRTLVLLNPPKDVHGAYMFFTFELFQKLLMPPFCTENLSNRVAGVEPRFFGESHLLNIARLKELAGNPQYMLALWDRKNMALERLDSSRREPLLSEDNSINSINSKVIASRERLFTAKDRCQRVITYSVQPPINPLQAQFLSVRLSNAPSQKAANCDYPDQLSISWSPQSLNLFGDAPWMTQPIYKHNDAREYLFCQSELESWSLNKPIDKIDIFLPRSCSASTPQVTLLSARQFMPKLKLSDEEWAEQPNGVHIPKVEHATIAFDASEIAQAVGVLIEVSQPYSQFQQYTNTLRDFSPSKHAGKTFELAARSGSFQIPPEAVRQPGWYQVRAAALSGARKLIGYFCDPIYLAVPQEQTKAVSSDGVEAAQMVH